MEKRSLMSKVIAYWYINNSKGFYLFKHTCSFGNIMGKRGTVLILEFGSKGNLSILSLGLYSRIIYIFKQLKNWKV
jgi:hypothetical protein